MGLPYRRCCSVWILTEEIGRTEIWKLREGKGDEYMMDYHTYKKFMIEILQQRFGEEAKVCLIEVNKINDTKLEALILKRKGEHLSPIVYLNSLYKEYLKKREPQDSVNLCMDVFSGKKYEKGWEIRLDWEYLRPRVGIRLIGRERNQEYLQDKIYVERMDLAVVFTVVLKQDEGGEAAVTVTESLMEACGADREALQMAAWENLMKEDFLIQSITEIIGELFQLKPEKEYGTEDITDMGLYVLSNKQRIFGARAMCRKDILKAFAEELGSNLYIIPSSVHELILTKDDGNISAGWIKEVVQEINGNSYTIKPEEVLSDSVYYYDRKTEEIQIMA